MSEQTVSFLLVEDDDVHAHLVTRCLQKSRIRGRITRIPDGAAALEYLQVSCGSQNRNLPDVILLDLKIPRIDGHELLTRIKSDPELKMIPVVILTTSNAESDRIRAYNEHVNSYVVKPVDFDEFQRLVVDVCRYWSIWNKSP